MGKNRKKGPLTIVDYIKHGLPFFLLIVSVVFFFLLRLPPLINHNVPYTYDQGRDFLQAAHIILDKKLTFLGPTTGVSGMFHGAWWYYVLIIPFLLFKGSPIGFYYFNCALQFGVFLLFVWFSWKYFNKSIAALMALIIATSPYFVMTALFTGDNIMAIPALLVFLLLNYRLFFSAGRNQQSPFWLLFCIGLFLGLVAEFELAFGMFIVPLYGLGILVFKDLRKTLLRLPNFFLFISGLFASFSLRIFFELRHDFLQTRALIEFFIKPHLYNPKPYIDVIRDRITLFKTYYEGLSGNWIVLLLIMILFLYLIVKVMRKHSESPVLRFFFFMVFGLFILSTFYKDNFWSNYYEGIHLFFLMILSILLSISEKSKIKDILVVSLMVILLLLGIIDSVKSFTNKPKIDGLIKMEKVVDYIDSQIATSGGNYCVKVYTPPAIPHTYNYLFLYHQLANKIPQPQSQWVNNKCWFILERDDYPARKIKWMHDQGLDRSKKLYGTTIVDTSVEYYEIKE